ncbi:hypothetical protein Pan189_36190 [Stratiformator vulcanicus]|uniref:Uncharacterized protein n=1 Tax=Stratiformator vulcanicus TaxID=2527980 RepID=A0A517R5N8_9PLAN|nr:hypothetical protein Pan189_36190 [Stratiformator vulcanicus]
MNSLQFGLRGRTQFRGTGVTQLSARPCGSSIMRIGINGMIVLRKTECRVPPIARCPHVGGAIVFRPYPRKSAALVDIASLQLPLVCGNSAAASPERSKINRTPTSGICRRVCRKGIPFASQSSEAITCQISSHEVVRPGEVSRRSGSNTNAPRRFTAADSRRNPYV